MIMLNEQKSKQSIGLIISAHLYFMSPRFISHQVQCYRTYMRMKCYMRLDPCSIKKLNEIGQIISRLAGTFCLGIRECKNSVRKQNRNKMLNCWKAKKTARDSLAPGVKREREREKKGKDTLKKRQ